MSKVEWVYSMGSMSILTRQSEVYGQSGVTAQTGQTDWVDWVYYMGRVTGQSKCMGRLGTLTGQTKYTDWVH